MIVLMGIIAVILGLPSGIAAGHGFARTVAQLLNLKLYSEAISGWVYLVLLAAGILVPIQVAHRPIIRATRITVREAINDYGINRNISSS